MYQLIMLVVSQLLRGEISLPYRRHEPDTCARGETRATYMAAPIENARGMRTYATARCFAREDVYYCGALHY